jgi:hypothetical protein
LFIARTVSNAIATISSRSPARIAIYSFRSASIGSRRAAHRGVEAKKQATAAVMNSPSATDQGSTAAGMGVLG